MSSELYDYAAFVRLVVDALEAAGVDYLIGGAVAVWAWGEPRATQDLDVVVDIPLEAIGQLSDELEKRGMLVPTDIILNIILEDRSDLPINAIQAQSGYKAELYPTRPNDELRRSALSRRKLVDLGPGLGEIYLHSPEDLILYKLWYFGVSRQTKHLRDITGIVLTLGDEFDVAYIEDWAERKGLTTIWKEILARIQP
jgi:hypothetical protein